MIPYMVVKLAPTSTHFNRGLVKYIPGRGYFRAVSSKTGTNLLHPRPPQSLNDSTNNNNSSSNNDTTTTCAVALLRPFDPGKGCQRDARIGVILGLDLPFDRGKAGRRKQHGGLMVSS